MNSKICFLLIIAALMLVYLIFETRRSIQVLMGSIAQMLIKIISSKMTPEQFNENLTKKVESTISRIGIFLKGTLFLVFVAIYLLLLKGA